MNLNTPSVRPLPGKYAAITQRHIGLIRSLIGRTDAVDYHPDSPLGDYLLSPVDVYQHIQGLYSHFWSASITNIGRSRIIFRHLADLYLSAIK